MTEPPNPPDPGKLITRNGRQKRALLVGLIANLTVVVALVALWLQGDFTIEILLVLAVAILLIINGAVWLGWRLSGGPLGTNRRLGPLVCFAAGGFAAIEAAFEIAGQNYASAGMAITGSVAVIALGVLGMRSKDRKDNG